MFFPTPRDAYSRQPNVHLPVHLIRHDVNDHLFPPTSLSKSPSLPDGCTTLPARKPFSRAREVTSDRLTSDRPSLGPRTSPELASMLPSMPASCRALTPRALAGPP